MKKLVPDTYSVFLPAVRMYEGDFQSLLDILKAKPDTTVAIEYDGTEYDSFAELREHEGHILRKLRIEAKSTGHDYGHISADFGDNRIHLFANRAFELQHRQIEELLRSCMRRIGKVPGAATYAFGVVVYTLLILAPHIAEYVFGLRPLAKAAVYVICYPPAFYISFGKVKLRRHLLVLRKPHEHQNVFQRHEKEFVKGSIGLIGAAIGSILTYIFKTCP